jgi:hypothetical protein
MRTQLKTLALLTLLACGDDESHPEDPVTDAASELDAGDEPNDAGSEASDGEASDGKASDGEASDGEASDGEASGPDAGGGSQPAQIELSGALSETIANVVPSASWRKSNDQGSLLHLHNGAAVFAAFTFTFMGPPEEGGTYDQTSSGLTCALSATRTSDNASWDAVHAIQGAADQGSCSVSLTSVVESVDLPTAKQYTVHGTVDGTLPAKQDSGAQGSVTLHATF